MAPILFHGMNQLGLPVVCVESRQAYQALKSLATTRAIAMTLEGWRHFRRLKHDRIVGGTIIRALSKPVVVGCDPKHHRPNC
jgi:hypothetical protein